MLDMIHRMALNENHYSYCSNRLSGLFNKLYRAVSSRNIPRIERVKNDLVNQMYLCSEYIDIILSQKGNDSASVDYEFIREDAALTARWLSINKEILISSIQVILQRTSAGVHYNVPRNHHDLITILEDAVQRYIEMLYNTRNMPRKVKKANRERSTFKVTVIILSAAFPIANGSMYYNNIIEANHFGMSVNIGVTLLAAIIRQP